jgi:hypothetical protein
MDVRYAQVIAVLNQNFSVVYDFILTHFILYLYGNARNFVQNDKPAAWYMFWCIEFLFFIYLFIFC